jgi:pyruvate/2-oxoacid:ferredoxin oxidoreductase alpha subunit
MGFKARSERLVVDGTQPVARVAHKLAEVIAIYPSTPTSSMEELADTWSATGARNPWGQMPEGAYGAAAASGRQRHSATSGTSSPCSRA